MHIPVDLLRRIQASLKAEFRRSAIAGPLREGLFQGGRDMLFVLPHEATVTEQTLVEFRCNEDDLSQPSAAGRAPPCLPFR